uniref:Uncharacterized protein n=1 Tax=Vitis vinifera TaxID=29760 RepID=A5BLJ3_VITVI|nr:hypothetical protein VITISV_023327 [Vitis vinifera]
MSVTNIWKLQENTVALCRKISQNVGRKYWKASGEHRGTVQNGYETLRLKRPPLPSGVKCRMRNIRMEFLRRRIPNVRHPGGMSAEQNSGCETSGWNVGGATSSGFPKRTRGALPYPDSLREKHAALAIITPRMIAYPIRICCPDHWLKCQALLQPTFRHPSMVCPDALSGHLLPWIPNNSPQSWIALVIKKLSKHQNLTQFD